jgi:hypothetical protein
MLDSKLRIAWANPTYYDRYQLVPEETIGHLFPNPNDSHWTGTKLRERLEQSLQSGEVLRDFRVPASSPGKSVSVGASRVPVATDTILLLVSLEEVDGEPAKAKAR